MKLAEALRVAPGRALAFTGAGGKSSTIARLAVELEADGIPVIVTTSTHLALGERSLARTHHVITGMADLAALAGALQGDASVLVTGGPLPNEPRWSGLTAPILVRLWQVARRIGAVLLIEADGARGRSLKVPAAHEPAVPSFVETVVPLAGLDVLGTPLGGGRVHHPERVARLLGLAADEPVLEDHLAHWLVSDGGALKGAPPKAEIRPLLNKADDDPRWRSARRIAELALATPRIRAVVIGAARADPPAREVVGRVAGVVLAAGESSRLGRPKQLIEWRGRPLIWHAARAAFEGGLSPVIVVTGHAAPMVGQALAGEPVRIVHNPTYAAGQSASLQAGLRAVEHAAEAAVFLLSDTPGVGAEIVGALVAEHRHSLSPIVAPRAGGRWANPVLFDRVTYPALMALEGDRGGRALFDRFRMAGIEWGDGILADIDTPADLRRFERRG